MADIGQTVPNRTFCTTALYYVCKRSEPCCKNQRQETLLKQNLALLLLLLLKCAVSVNVGMCRYVWPQDTSLDKGFLESTSWSSRWQQAEGPIPRASEDGGFEHNRAIFQLQSSFLGVGQKPTTKLQDAPGRLRLCCRSSEEGVGGFQVGPGRQVGG